MDWKNYLEKKPLQKIEKIVKISAKLPHVNKKPLQRNRIFVQTPFSHSTLKLERKNSRRKTTRFFAPFPVSAWPKSPLQFDFKNHEMCEQILKKNMAGQVLTYNSKNFHWLNRTTRPRVDYEWIEKTIFKKSDQNKKKETKIQCQNAACEQKKPLARYEN